MDSVYMMILNIPPNFHASDLRHFFSDFLERQTHFSCFHFRHRPQHELVKFSEITNKKFPGLNNAFLIENSRCCLVKLFNQAKRKETIQKYHFQNWINKDDTFLSSRCISICVTVVENSLDNLPISSLCLNDNEAEIKLTLNKIEEMIELKPPPLMPQGNIGTPTKHFLALIQSCRLPTKLIGKLGLNFPKTKTQRYGSVPFNYRSHTSEEIVSSKNEEDNTSYGSTTHSKAFLIDKNNKERVDDEEQEEWDRHEDLHDDVTEQERNKERLYEEEMEVVWEKGGPGIVWYTDAQRWKETEGDFDEQTTDDWDVDYSVYSEENGGDKDARDCLDMRRSTMWRQGNMESVFKKPQGPLMQPKPHIRHSAKTEVVGPFEKHTKGIGRRLMEKHGWRDGCGLGIAQKGIAKPIESEGQKPKERKGLGYFGERLPRFRTANSNTSKGSSIATIYDTPSEIDSPESLYQRNEPTTMKYREMYR
ncbi:hypothetical protein DAPPUDRAFT_337114 [Daphnia pulex]|uniref:G-patch domain-containing protein n=1 Tax=Daphnia pulex TaxID=6669 RepID=E9I110_DAPPU|nr:hypothetical protein DAPPUDRAFT_337114 [Daphnia pulex]|eukprot:EFX62321.1 hypothetical protein DAPPUDRAFT_337114 [Daphnia pulex]